MILKDRPSLPKGSIRIEVRDKATKETKRIVDVNNVITYEGAKVLSHTLVGDSEYRLTHIYGEHAASGVYTPGSLNGLVAAKSDTIDTLRTSPRDTVNAESPIIFANYYTSEAPYNENVVTITASWNSELLNGRILVGAGLVVQYRSAEYLFAHAYFPAQVKVPGEELICHWSELFK